MQPNLNIVVKGFKVFEQRIIETTVKLSQGRTPKLTLLPDNAVNRADIVLLDGVDSEAVEWSNSMSDVLGTKMVVWIDADQAKENPKHSQLYRPVLWVNLPIILTRILDELEQKEFGESLSLKSQAEMGVSEPSRSSSAHDIRVHQTQRMKGKVLVVDDSKAVRDYLLKMLSDNKYEADGAEDGEVAVEKATMQYYDCVLMDVLMPGIDGYKACREIRKMKQYESAMSVVMLTSRTSPFDKVRGKMAGCNAYLTKPVSIKKLLETVSEQVSK